jgi:hypothetical protein
MAAGDLRGDSGTSINECENVNIIAPYISGQADLGVYFTDVIVADPANATGGGYRIFGGQIENCTSGFKTHRQGRYTTVVGTSFKRVGLCALFAGSTPEGTPGREVIITGCHARSINSFVKLGMSVRGQIIGNMIEDYGFNPFTPVTPSGEASAIAIKGGQRNIITNNIIRQRNLDGTTGIGTRAISFLDDVVATDVPGADAGTYQSTDNIVDGNQISGKTLYGLYEDDVATDNVGDNAFDDLVTIRHHYATGSKSQFRTKGINSGAMTTVTTNGPTTVAVDNETEVFLYTGSRTASQTVTYTSTANRLRVGTRRRTRNATTGGFNLVVAGVTVAPGASADLVWNGTAWVQV